MIRRARLGDEKGIHDAHMRSIREVCIKDHGAEEILGWGNRPFSSRWTTAIENDEVWVVELDGEIHGHGLLRFEESHSFKAHIHGLYLTPDALGKGFGKELARLMLASAKARKAQSITLESTLTAHAFYQHLGFQDTGPLQKLEIQGHPVSYYPMKLDLQVP